MNGQHNIYLDAYDTDGMRYNDPQNPNVYWDVTINNSMFPTSQEHNELNGYSPYSPTDCFSPYPMDMYPNNLSYDNSYQAMQSDDLYFDSIHIDFSLFQNLPTSNSAEPKASAPRKTKKTYSEALGMEFAHPPIPPPSDSAVVKSDQSESEPAKKDKKHEICRYWQNGECIYGDRCWYAHTSNPDYKQPQLEYSTECCICQEDVLKEGKRFGLLQNCTHVFCLECIRNWRYSHFSDSNVRQCPVCRATSFYVIPSSVPIFDEEVKKQIIAAYKENMAQIPCKYFNGGYGICPFGESCFYSHKLANGQTFTPRMVMQADGELRDIGCSNCLGEYMVVDQPQEKQKRRRKHKKTVITGDN